MITIHDVQQGTPEWDTLREGLYTGSNAAKLLRYGAGDRARTTSRSFSGNFHTKRGHLLEDEAIELYAEITETSINRPGFVTNSRYPNAGYSPDGLGSDALIEVKCFNVTRHLQVIKEIPLEIEAQIHFGMLVCERHTAKLILYNPRLAKTDPALALVVVDIRENKTIQKNFITILSKETIAI